MARARAWDLETAAIAVRDVAGERVLETRLPGPHNAANAAGALAVAELLGLDRESAAAAVAVTPAPVGRCTRADVDAPFDVLLDFAKNPAGFATAVATARGVAGERGGRVIAVVSASPADDLAGLEAKGRAAAEGADAIVVTTERWEDTGPAEPPAALVRGVRSGAPEVEVVAVRRDALARGVALAQPGDVLAVIGRSPAPRPQVDAGGRTQRFDDVAELRAALSAAGV